jgi:hypothetical protein
VELLLGIFHLLMYGASLSFCFGIAFDSSQHNVGLTHRNVGHIDTLPLQSMVKSTKVGGRGTIMTTGDVSFLVLDLDLFCRTNQEY